VGDDDLGELVGGFGAVEVGLRGRDFLSADDEAIGRFAIGFRGKYGM
jgi:hypothetical protein